MSTHTTAASNTGLGKSEPARHNGRPFFSVAATVPRSFTTSTSSVINAGKTVPPRFKELYDSLDGVRDAAIEQVSLSRLQLALRGLESEAPLIRVAGEFLQA